MWTAKLTNKQIKDGKVILNIEYTDGKETLYDVVTLTVPTDIKNIATARIQQLQNLSAYADGLTVGNVDLTPPVIPTPPTPTQDEIDQANYFALLEKWTIAKADVDKGLLDKSDPIFTKLTTDLKVAYQPKYSGL
jgi:hypothetical protein